MIIYSRFSCLIICSLIITGCATKAPPLYVYNDYSATYYKYKKDLSEESLLDLQLAIEEAIEMADESSSGRPPPGMFANVGYIYLKQGKSHEAIAAFNKEKSLYPEAAHFMDRMIKKVEISEGMKNE